MPSALILVSDDGRVLGHDPAARIVLGLASGADLAAALHAAFPDLPAGPAPVQGRGCRADGQVLYARALPWHGAASRLLRIDTEDRDAARRAERQLAHDARSPLMSIMALAQGVHEGALPAPPDPLGASAGLAERALAKLDALLVLMRAAADNTEPRELFDPLQALHDAADACWALARQRGIALHIEGPPEAGLVLGSLDGLRRALDGLIRHALHAAAPGAALTLQVTADATRLRVAVPVPAPLAADAPAQVLAARIAGRCGGELRPDGVGHLVFTLPRAAD